VQSGFGAWGGVEKELSADELRRNMTAELEEIAGVIAGCKEDIKALWEDGVVQSVLSKRKYRVDESSGLCVLRIPRSLPRQKTDVGSSFTLFSDRNV
jgi:hypothetical protein